MRVIWMRVSLMKVSGKPHTGPAGRIARLT